MPKLLRGLWMVNKIMVERKKSKKRIRRKTGTLQEDDIMLRLAIPFKKPVTVDNFCKFHEELEEITEKYFGHSEILVIFGVDNND